MSIKREGVHLAAAETDTDIRSLGGPINEAIDTPLDATEKLAIRFPRPFRPPAPRAPRPEGKGGAKGKKKSDSDPHVHGKGVHGRATKHHEDMSAILGGSYALGPKIWDAGRGVAFDASILLILLAIPAGLALTAWTVLGLAVITKVSPFLGAYLRRFLIGGVKRLTRVLGKEYLFGKYKDKSNLARLAWNFLDGMEEFSRVVDDLTDRAIQLIPFGIGDRILKWRQRAEALLGSKPDPRREAVRKDLDKVFGWLLGTTAST